MAKSLINKSKLFTYVKKGLKDGIIEIKEGAPLSGCFGIICSIYGQEFYFDNNADNYETVKEYIADNPPEKIAEKVTQAIYDCHKDLDFDIQGDERPEEGEFYGYYEYLRNHYRTT